MVSDVIPVIGASLAAYISSSTTSSAIDKARANSFINACVRE